MNKALLAVPLAANALVGGCASRLELDERQTRASDHNANPARATNSIETNTNAAGR